MEFRAVEDLIECEKVWKTLSPGNTLSTDWEFRKCFFDAFGEKPLFLTYFSEVPVVCIPLSYVPEEKRHLFFGGGNWVERNIFLSLKNRRNYIPELLKKIPENTILYFIDPFENDFGFKEDAPTFFIELENIKTFDDYIMRFSQKHRKNIRYDIRQIEKNDLVLHRNNMEHFPFLAKLNKTKFGQEATLVYESYQNAMKNIVERMNGLNMISIEIGGKVVAIEIGILYGNVYTVLQGGSDPSFANIYKYLIMTHINDALLLKARRIDFLSDDCGWKTAWHLKSEMLYKYEPNDSYSKPS